MVGDGVSGLPSLLGASPCCPSPSCLVGSRVHNISGSLTDRLETYLPIIIAKNMTQDGVKIEKKKLQWGVILTRPLRMFSEPIVLFTSIYLAIVYAIFYLFFESISIIYKGMLFQVHAQNMSNDSRSIRDDIRNSSTRIHPKYVQLPPPLN